MVVAVAVAAAEVTVDPLAPICWQDWNLKIAEVTGRFGLDVWLGLAHLNVAGICRVCQLPGIPRHDALNKTLTAPVRY